MSSDRQVGAWTTPEPGRPLACWKDTTAALVLGPNTPSAVSLAPCAFSRYCREVTVTFGQALLLPCCSTGQAGWVAAAVAYGITVAATAGLAALAAAGGADMLPSPAATATASAVGPTRPSHRPFIEDASIRYSPSTQMALLDRLRRRRFRPVHGGHAHSCGKSPAGRVIGRA